MGVVCWRLGMGVLRFWGVSEMYWYGVGELKIL